MANGHQGSGESRRPVGVTMSDAILEVLAGEWGRAEIAATPANRSLGDPIAGYDADADLAASIAFDAGRAPRNPVEPERRLPSWIVRWLWLRTLFALFVAMIAGRRSKPPSSSPPPSPAITSAHRNVAVAVALQQARIFGRRS
jgi:hypothetical protein